MSDIEHLLENAVYCLKNKEDFEDFTKMWQTQDQLTRTKATADEIWMMAQWVLYVYKPSIIADYVPLCEYPHEMGSN